jgi:hypothetical protein
VSQNQNNIKETPVLFNSVPSEHLHGKHHKDKYEGIKIDRVHNIYSTLGKPTVETVLSTSSITLYIMRHNTDGSLSQTSMVH